MATKLDDAVAIADAVRAAGVKAVIEPSASSALDPDMAELRRLVKAGVLGEILWYSLGTTGPSSYGPALGMNPYGQDAFFTKDSGGFLYDLPYAPANIVGVLGPCRSVMAQARTIVQEHDIVPEEAYDAFLAGVTDPHQANFWDAVFDLPRTKRVRMEAIDNAYSLYEMENGAQGACHVGRIYHPTLPEGDRGALQIFGSDGNLIFGAGYMASIISTHKDLLPHVDPDGWYHIPRRGDLSKAQFPKPTPGAFHYYHASTQHLIDCILGDREPIVGIDWGLHITEMMWGTEQSARTGMRYDMTTTLWEVY